MSRIISRIRILSLVLIALSFSALISQVSFAKSSLSADDEAMFSQNDILFYEPCGGSSGEKTSSEICGSNQNYAGTPIFNETQMEAIKHFQPFYEKAAAKYGFPWEILAVLHYRENGLAKNNPNNGEGAYQLTTYTDRGNNSNAFKPAGAISDEEFQRQTDITARLIHEGYGAGLDLSTDNGVKKMFFNYNGPGTYVERAKKMGFSDEEANRGEGSPYVMNKYDARRDPDNPGVDSNWVGKYTSNGVYDPSAVDQQWGTFTAYKALTCTGNSDASDDSDDAATESESDSSSSSNISDSSDIAKRIAETALKLAYSYEDRGKADGENPKQEFIDATTELGTWDKNKSHGPDCGFFVKAVIATVDPDIVYEPKDAKMDTFRNQLVSEDNSWSTKDNKYTEKYWDVIDFSDGKTSKLQSGDVVWGKNNGSKQHYFIVSEINGKLYKVDASYGNKKWGRVSKELGEKYKSYTTQKIFRAKGSDNNKPSCNANVQGSMNINATGAALAWPLGTDPEKYTLATGKVLESVLTSPGQTDTFSGTGAGTTLFQKAWIESGMSGNGMTEDTQHGRYSWRYGAYCCGFTAVVARYSGYDKHFSGILSDGGYQQVDYANEHKDLWDVEKWDGDKSSLQGGDIMVSYGHSNMIIEDEKGELYIAEASLSSGAFGHITEYRSPLWGTTYRIRAKNANNSNVGVSVTNGVKSSSTSGTITKSGRGNGDIGASAIELAWPQGTSDDTIQKSAFEKFSKYFSGLSQSQSDKGQCYADGKSCDRFVATSVRYSGVDENMSFGPVSSTLDHLEKTDSWEEVNMSNPKSTDEYKSGDVLIFYRPGKTSPSHTAIYAVDSSGENHLVQASYCEYFGVVKDTSNITSAYFDRIRVFRNKNNATGGGSSECNLCSDEESEDNGISGNLQDGGFKSAEEADKAVMTEYRSLWNNNPLAESKYHINVGCNGHHINNCPSFVRYFVNKYTTKTWTGATGNGRDVAGNIAKAYNLDTSNTPSAYSVFSVAEGITMCGFTPCGHTGIVLGVDTSRGKVIIGEAGCGSGLDFIKAKEKDLSKFTSGKYTFTNLNDILKTGGLQDE